MDVKLLSVQQQMFSRMILEQGLSLLCGSIIILLYRYGLENYCRWAYRDRFSGIAKLFQIFASNFSTKELDSFRQPLNEDLESKHLFQLVNPAQIILATNLTQDYKIIYLGQTLYRLILGIAAIGEDAPYQN